MYHKPIYDDLKPRLKGSLRPSDGVIHWNSAPRTFNFFRETMEHEKADFTAPVKELVDQRDQAILSDLFDETDWEESSVPRTTAQEDPDYGSLVMTTDPVDLIDVEKDEEDEEESGDDVLTFPDPFFELLQRGREDKDLAAILKKMAHMADGPFETETSEEERIGAGGWDFDEEDLFPSDPASRSSAGKPSAPRHVHNTKRKGLSRKKDKTKKKKK